METIKTAVVVTCLLGVLYGVYTILNKPELETPPEISDAWDKGEIDMDVNIDFDPPTDFGSTEFGPEGSPSLAVGPGGGAFFEVRTTA